LAHTINPTFKPFEWWNMIKETQATRCVHMWRGCNNGGLDVVYTRL
jgi:hypothetical protein